MLTPSVVTHSATPLSGQRNTYAPSTPVGAELVAEGRPAVRVLVLDEDAALCSSCCELVRGLGYDAIPAATVAAARATLQGTTTDLLLLDLTLHQEDGLALLHEVNERHPHTGVIVMTAFGSISSAVEVMRLGARDYLTKPFLLQDLAAVIERAAGRVHFDAESRKLRERLRTDKGMGNFIGRSPAMEKVYRILSKVAFSTHPVLILGEPGTGKEMVARSIHANGPRAGLPFLRMDCSALGPAAIESELFGCVKGALSVSSRGKQGLLAAAGEGTVFLDEIGGLPLEVQGRLLRAIQEKEFRPVGGAQGIPFSARILGASSRDLPAMVTAGTLRRDLFLRLNVVSIKMPPLRERRDDIRALAEFFLERCEKQHGTAHSFSAEAMRVMTQYDWPGNVRELEHAIDRACALASGRILHMTDLPTQLHDFHMHADVYKAPGGPANQRDRIMPIADMERQAIVETIRQLSGDKLTAARLLGIGKTTLYRKLKEYGISAAELGS